MSHRYRAQRTEVVIPSMTEGRPRDCPTCGKKLRIISAFGGSFSRGCKNPRCEMYVDDPNTVYKMTQEQLCVPKKDDKDAVASTA